jgi:hypothetical protein
LELGSVRHLSFTSLACKAQMTKWESRKMTSPSGICAQD